MPLKASILMFVSLYSAGCIAADQAPLSQPPPLWSGKAGWLFQNQSILVHEGTHPIGALILEHDMTFVRTGILKQSIRLTDASGAEIVLPEGSKAFATRINLPESGASEAGAGPVEWCVASTRDPGSIPETVCILWESEQRARYDQYLWSNGFALKPNTAGSSGMHGVVPQIEERAVDFGVQFKRQQRLWAVSEHNVTLEVIHSDGKNTSAVQRVTYDWESNGKVVYPVGSEVVELTRAADGKSVDVRHVTELVLDRGVKEVTVVLALLVGVDGRVKDGHIVKSSGYPQVDARTIAEVKRAWRLEPGKQKGKPVERWGQFTVTFKLTD